MGLTNLPDTFSIFHEQLSMDFVEDRITRMIPEMLDNILDLIVESVCTIVTKSGLPVIEERPIEIVKSGL